MEELEKNPFFTKYQSKLQHLQSEYPKEFKEKLSTIGKNKYQYTESVAEQANSKKTKMSVTNPGWQYRKLESIVKLDLFHEKTPDEIADIWNQYHRDKTCQGSLSAVINGELFEKILKRAKEYPMFLYPVPRSDSYEFILGQFNDTDCYFTPLMSYQRHGENAPICLSLHHYSDLLSEKHIVLMRGQIRDTNILKPMEAQCIINLLQLYYGQDAKEREKLLKEFTESPQTFDYRTLLNQIQSLSIPEQTGL